MDPLRLSEEGSEATEFERELLAAGQRTGMSAEQRQQAWTGILLQIPPTPSAAPPAAAGIPVETATQGSLLGLKALLTKTVGIAALVAAVGGGYLAFSEVKTAETPATPRLEESAPTKPLVADASTLSALEPAAQEVSEPGSGDTGAALSDERSVQASPRQALGAAGTSRGSKSSKKMNAATDSGPAAPPEAESAPVTEEEERASQLREESMAVLEIRRTLRGGDPSGALRLLEGARRNFPSGALGQEREALAIEALARSGNASAASRRAMVFLEKFPKSPYAADMRVFARP